MGVGKVTLYTLCFLGLALASWTMDAVSYLRRGDPNTTFFSGPWSRVEKKNEWCQLGTRLIRRITS